MIRGRVEQNIDLRNWRHMLSEMVGLVGAPCLGAVEPISQITAQVLEQDDTGGGQNTHDFPRNLWSSTRA